MERSRKRPVMETGLTLREDALRDGTMLFFQNGVTNPAARDLIEAVIGQDTPRLKKLLAASGSWPDVANAFGVTPLMMAAARGYAEGVEILSAHPLTTLDRAAVNGWTALHFAARFGEADCARTLLRRYAARDVKNAEGKTPEDIATGDAAAVFAEKEKDLRRATEAAERPPTAAPAKIPTPGERSFAAFIAAAGEGDLAACAEAAEKILGLGMDVSVFHYLAQDGLRAALNGNPDAETIAWLVQLGAQPAISLTQGRREMLDVEDPLRHKTFRFPRTAFNEACLRNDAKAVREMVLWHDRAPDRDAVAVFSNRVQADFDRGKGKRLDDKIQRDMMSALSLAEDKRRVKGLASGRLRDAFNDAVRREDANGIAACWAESRQRRFFRDRVTLNRMDAADALALMLLAENYSVALNMIDAGASLAYAHRKFPERIKRKADPRADDILRRTDKTQKTLRRIEEARNRKTTFAPAPPHC